MSNILVNTGSIISEPADTVLTTSTVPNGIEVGSTAGPVATLVFTGDSAITSANPTFGSGVLVDAQIAGQTTAEQSLLNLLGISVNAGAIAADGPVGSTFALAVQASTATAGNFLNTGTLAVLAGNDMVLAAASGSTVRSNGTINVAAGGTLAVDNAVLGGAVVNNGSILVVGDGTTQTGTVEVSGALSGTGTLDIGTNGILKLDSATTQSIAFPTVGAGVLILPGPGTYSMPLLGLNTGDKIALTSGGAISNVSVSGSTITITSAGGTTVLQNASFAAGANQSFYWFLDGGTGDWTAVEAPFNNNWTGGISTALGTAGNWSSGAPTSLEALNFNSGGVLTGSADGLTATFNGPDGWTLNSATLDLAGNPNPPFDPFALILNTNVILNGATLNANGTSGFANGVTITAQGGSSVTTAGDIVGDSSGQFASLILSGAGTNWSESANPALGGNGFAPGYLTVGNGGTGLLSVTNGASLNTGFYAVVGNNTGGVGAATITAGGQWTTAGLTVGNNAGSEGQLIVAGGTVELSGTFAAVGYNAGSSGQLVIGAGGTVAATTPPPSTSTSYLFNIGDHAGGGSAPANGSVFVNGAGALLDLDGNGLSLGINGGQGSLTISSGGTVKAGTPNSNDVGALSIGKLGQGNLTVTDPGSALLMTGGGYDGRGGTGNILVENGGLLSVSADALGNGGLGIGLGASSNTNAIGGSGSAGVTSNGRIYTQNGITVGGFGVNGVLNVSNGGSVEVGTRLGVGSGGTVGTVALGGVGEVNIGAGGTIQVDATTIAAGQAAVWAGDFAGAKGSINVDGAGALLNVLGTNVISLGTYNDTVANSSSGEGGLSVTQGGLVEAYAIDVGNTGIGSMDVQTGGSVAVDALRVAGGHVVGTIQEGGTGSLNIDAGSTVTVAGLAGSAAVAVGYLGGAVGQVNVAGSGALLNVGTNSISLGTYNNSVANSSSGDGSLSVTQGGQVQAGRIYVGYTGSGSMNVETGGSIAVSGIAVAGGQLVGTIQEAGNGSVNIGAGSTVTVAGVAGIAAVGVGYYGGAVGQVNVTGPGALLNVLGANYITLGTSNTAVANSTSGDGSMTVSQGALVNAADFQVGYTGQGALTVNAGTVAVGSALSVGAGLLVGTLASAGFGVVNIGANGTINVAGTGLASGTPAVTAGSYVGATGIINVSGSHALLNAGTHDIRLGTNSGTVTSSGAGSLTTSFGGIVQAGTIIVGDSGAGSFNADIGGASATALDVGAQASGQGNIVLTSALTGVGINALTIGDQGLGRVAATAGANLVVYSTAIVGNAAGSDGQLAVTGGAHFRTYYLIDGQSGTGALTVSGGATGEIINAATIGFGGTGGAGTGNLAIGANGTVTVDGTGLAAGAAAVSVGDYANATGIISVGGSHALLNAGTHDIRLGTNAGNPASSGAGFLTATLGGIVQAGTIYVGDTGTGVFSANIGGASANAIDLGAQATGQGSMLLTGAVTGVGLNALTVGDKGYGKVTESNSANLVVHGNVVLGNAAGATGQVSIASNAYFQANTLTVGGSGSGAFSVDSGAVLNALNAATVGATGVLTLQGGKAVAAQFTNQGNIAGNGTVQGPLVNNGVVTSSAGSLSITGAITGTGVLAMSGNSGLVVGAVGAGQEFAFGAAGATLQLGNLAATSASVIAGFGAGDQIRVVTTGSIGTSFNATTDALTITAGSTSKIFQVTGSHTEADFASSVVGVDTVLAANQTINLGTGPHLLFLGGSSTGDTIVAPSLPAAGASNFLDITGFGGTDILDFRAALAGTTWDGSAGDIGNYLSVAMSGSSAVISLSQTSSGTGVGLVKLESSGPMTLSQVLAHATI